MGFWLLFYLKYDINVLKEQGLEIVEVRAGEIPQAGSLSSPFAANYGRVESGWIIRAENHVNPFRSVITGQMVTEM